MVPRLGFHAARARSVRNVARHRGAQRVGLHGDQEARDDRRGAAVLGGTGRVEVRRVLRPVRAARPPARCTGPDSGSVAQPARRHSASRATSAASTAAGRRVLTGHSPLDDLCRDVARDQRQRAVRERVAGATRQGEPELRATARGAPGLQPAAVQPGVLERDGQAEAGAAGGARPGRVGAPEPVEHHRRLARLEPDAVVADGQRGRLAVGGQPDGDAAAVGVVDRVGQQVAHDPLDPAYVDLGHEHALVDGSTAAPRAAAPSARRCPPPGARRRRGWCPRGRARRRPRRSG